MLTMLTTTTTQSDMAAVKDAAVEDGVGSLDDGRKCKDRNESHGRATGRLSSAHPNPSPSPSPSLGPIDSDEGGSRLHTMHVEHTHAQLRTPRPSTSFGHPPVCLYIA